jgi:hypothetical protein
MGYIGYQEAGNVTKIRKKFYIKKRLETKSKMNKCP